MITLKFKQLYYFAFIAMIFSLSTAAFSQTRSYRVNDRQVEILLNRLETRTDAFRLTVNREFYRESNGNFNREDGINSYVADFENATDALKSNFDERDSTTGDVQEVLNRAAFINGFIRDNRVARATQNQWNLIRTDLNTLAGFYRVSWNWNNSQNPNNQVTGFDSRLTGTYRLNAGQSDNVSATIDKAISRIKYNANQRERTKNNLERRLISPDTLMIEKRGPEVTLSSSTSARVSFNADGVSRSETADNGRTMLVRAASTKSDLTLNYEGDRMNDYYVSFTPLSNGQLRISRRVYLENRNETVTVASVYDKTDRQARWETTDYPNKDNGKDDNDFVIPNNTPMTATLDAPLSTKTAKDDDKFTMTVTSPSQYQGAVIGGRVIGEKSGIVSGRANLSLNFETIRLRNGRTYRFAGIVEQVREPNGNEIKVNNEGTVRDDNQTVKTATRAGIGAVIGAIVGAVAGGGKGAAVGAAIGGGAGAGTVILQGRDNLELSNGTEFTITATSSGNLATPRAMKEVYGLY
jgi:hypothetical protein